MKYSIIIISKDNRGMLLNCLRHLVPEVSGRAEIVVAEAGDNAASLGVEGVSHLRLPQSETGFSPQRNAGVRAASGEYIIFIDDDIEVLPGWFERITSGPHESAEVFGCMGAVFPKPSGVISFITGVLGHPGGGFRLHHHSGQKLLPLPQIATCNTVLRKAVVESVGGFSLSVNYGGEDSDISMKVQEKYGGERFRYLPNAMVWHYSKNEFGKLLRWYLRRGFSDAELFMQHPSHRRYALRSAILLKVLPVLILGWLVSPLVLICAFVVWYMLQALRMRFMIDYFYLYDFSVLGRVSVYAAAPFVKLVADLSMDAGRGIKGISLWLNA